MTPNTHIDAVVWDIGNVLIDWNPERFYDRLMPREDRERMFAEVPIFAVNQTMDAGAHHRDTVYRLAEAHPRWADMIRHWHDSFVEMNSPAIAGSVHLLLALRRRGVPVFALSNFGDQSFTLAERAFPFLGEFDRRYVSGRMKMLKPDPRFYEALERDSGVAPERLVFVDDRAENIAAAQARGWHTHLFTTPEAWGRALLDLGLLTEADLAPLRAPLRAP